MSRARRREAKKSTPAATSRARFARRASSAARDPGRTLAAGATREASLELLADPAAEAEAELRTRGLEARAIYYDLCRRDVNAFCEYVLRDDETGERIEQREMHVEMQASLDVPKARVVWLAHPESGKTSQMVGRILWELGNNPNLRIVILGNTQDGAKAPLSSIKKYIENSAELHNVFPDLKPGSVWQDVRISVKRDTYSKDPSVQAVGYKGQVLGKRIDLAFGDDFQDGELTYTAEQRKQSSKWFRGTFMSRMTRNARVAYLTNAWHPSSLEAELPKERGWKVLRYPIFDVAGSITWDRWTTERIAQAKFDLGELEFARVFLCVPYDVDAQIFKPDSIEACKRRGKGYTLIRSLRAIPDGCVVVHGVDIGGSGTTSDTGALSAIFSLLIHPSQDRQPLSIEAGRWGGGELIRRIHSVGDRFGGIVAVENNAIQQHIVDLAIESRLDVIPIIPFTTGRNKLDPRFGVSSMAVEFENVRWILPEFGGTQEDQLEAWRLELLEYVPSKHTGDRMMAMWIAREIGRRYWKRIFGAEEDRPGGVGATIVG